ncbi:MAG: glycosyltransferase family 2 protein [Phycisphaerae bacterium]
MPELVSTIIPTYNRAALLVRALDSVAAQSYRPIEVVIVDDGSTDNTVDVVHSRRPYLEGRGIDVIFHQQKNQKAPRARNVGMQLARGSLIAFLDSDDLWLPTFVETVVRLMDQNPACGMGFSGILGIDDDDVVFAERKMYIDPDPEEGVLRKPFDRVMRYMPTQTSGVIVRKKVIEEIGDFDLTLPVVEDWDLWYRIAKRFDMCYTTRPLACNRSHPDNLPKTDTLALAGSIKMNLTHLKDVSDPFTHEVLTARIRRQITLLQEQIMREGKQANGYTPLLENELAPDSWRFKLGELIRHQPQWVGSLYAWAIRKVGEIQRNEWIARSRQRVA